MKRPALLLSGCGKMGGALLRAWEDRGLFDLCYVVDPHAAARENDMVRVVAAPQDIPAGFHPDIVILAVKPQVMADVLPAYRGFAENGSAVLSIAAGLPLAFFENILGAGSKIIRAMPNTPAAIGQGMTVACANAACAARDKALAETLLSATGAFLWAGDESLLNPVTALSGSGPAYVFLLIEILEQAGARIGLSPEMARVLARQTVVGAAALAAASPETPAAVLRENVTSPGGTTEAALRILMQGDAQDIFDQALMAATDRAKELAQ